MISLLLTFILSFASDSCNNKDIILILGYNYNLFYWKKHRWQKTLVVDDQSATKVLSTNFLFYLENTQSINVFSTKQISDTN